MVLKFSFPVESVVAVSHAIFKGLNRTGCVVLGRPLRLKLLKLYVLKDFQDKDEENMNCMSHII